jgi:hypothetical protein
MALPELVSVVARSLVSAGHVAAELPTSVAAGVVSQAQSASGEVSGEEGAPKALRQVLEYVPWAIAVMVTLVVGVAVLRRVQARRALATRVVFVEGRVGGPVGPGGSSLVLALEGAQRMLAAALEAEVDADIAALADQRDEAGRRLVVRNGHAEARTITTAPCIEVETPRVNDRRVDEDTGERCRFRSSILPPWCRKSPKVAEVLPLMYLHGMSTPTSPRRVKVLRLRRRAQRLGGHPPHPPGRPPRPPRTRRAA